MTTLLEVSNLTIWDGLSAQTLVSNSSFHLRQGSCLAIAGESGSGKSLTCRAILRLNKAGLHQTGDIAFQGKSLLQLSEHEMRAIRGRRICLIMQNGMRAFDPSRVVGVQLAEMIKLHVDWSKHELQTRIRKALESVLLPADRVLNQYPHQLSGGMLQRLMIAVVLVMEPELVIADEPTTALDAISQYEVVEQLIKLRERMGCSMILVSHDLAVIRRIADEALIMKKGEIVESGSVQSIFAQPQHEYTRYLVSARQTVHRHFQQMMGGHRSC